MSDDETLSVISKSSTTSVSNLSMKCPYCDWNKTSRLLFNHIHLRHPDQIYSALGTSKLIKSNLEHDNLLELNMTWEGYKDDDEFKEFPEQKQLHIFGCLGCNQTYQTKARAKAHWKKSEKCHADHTKYANRYLEKVQKAEKKQGDKTWIDNLKDKELYDAIERLARWYHRVVHLDLPFLLAHDLNRGVPFDLPSYDIKTAKSFPSREAKIDAYKKYTKLIRNLEIDIGRTLTVPFDYRIPTPWNYQNDAQEDGLPPVGTNFEEQGKALVEQHRSKPMIDDIKSENILEKKQSELKTTLAKTPEPVVVLAPKLEPIQEEPPKKEKRPSITTLNNKDLSSVLRSPSPAPQQRFPAIIGNTKRQIKLV